VREVAVQQQCLDEQPGAAAIPGVLAGQCPERIVRAG